MLTCPCNRVLCPFYDWNYRDRQVDAFQGGPSSLGPAHPHGGRGASEAGARRGDAHAAEPVHVAAEAVPETKPLCQ